MCLDRMVILKRTYNVLRKELSLRKGHSIANPIHAQYP